MIQIKICGITRLKDALAALDCGVRILGFNFYPKSARHISWESYTQLRYQLENYHYPDVIYTGVFVNPKTSEIHRAISNLDLDQVQLHGDEAPEILAAFEYKGIHAYKAIRPQTLEEAEFGGSLYGESKPAPALLIDAYHQALYGGSGVKGNWDIARAIAAQYPILLAGGLTPGNVADAIHQVLPWGVDTASGVEKEPGNKDAQKIKDFVLAVQQASQDLQHDE